jgi:hypothetical protein
VACICPMGVELAPVQAMLDRTHPSLPTQRDQNHYTLGEIEGHNIVIGVLPEIGTNAAATVAIWLLNDFPLFDLVCWWELGVACPMKKKAATIFDWAMWW